MIEGGKSFLNFLTKNLKTLKHVDSYTAYLINKSEDGRNIIDLSFTAKGIPICKVSSLLLHSQYDPISDAERWARKSLSKISNNKKIVIFGFGLGYHLKSLLKLKNNLKLVVIEPSSYLIKKAMEIGDFSEFLQNIRIYTGENAKKLLYDLEEIKRSPFIVFSPEDRIWKEYYEELLSVLNQATEDNYLKTSTSIKKYPEIEEIILTLPGKEKFNIKNISRVIKEKGNPGKAAKALLLIEKFIKNEIL